MDRGSKLKKLAKIRGKAQALREAITVTRAKALAKANKGAFAALGLASVLGTIGAALGARGKLSIPIKRFRFPVAGSVGLGLLFLAWKKRGTPTSKYLVASGVSSLGAQAIDWATHGMMVKAEDSSK